MSNYFADNPDLVFHFNQLDLSETAAIGEDGYRFHEQFPYAPANYEDAMDNYQRVLELVGNIAGNHIAERAAAVDEQGATAPTGSRRLTVTGKALSR